jgi:WXG100 family type VII secretion target
VRRSAVRRRREVNIVIHVYGSGVTFRVAQTQAQAQVMETTASKFETVNTQLQQMLSTLLSNLEQLQSKWVGAGGTSFTAVKNQWVEDQGKIQRALLETATAIRSSGQNYTVTDDQAQSRVSATNSGGIQLPL